MKLKIWIGPALILTACASPQKNAVPEAAWINNMHRLSAAHLYILPVAADGRKFTDPAVRAKISGELKALAETATAIANDPRAPDADPMIRYTAVGFATDLRQAYSSFQTNDPQLARFTVGRMSRYCIGCHTRADRGVRDFPVSWSSELGALTAGQRIEFYLANRRYQSAFSAALAMAKIEGDPFAKREPRAWLLAIKRTMGMIVRVNDDPAQAEDLAFSVYSNKTAPIYVRREAAGWVRDIREWRDDKRRAKKDAFKSASVLLETRPSFVRALRASALLHGLLEDSKSPRYAEAMLYSGLAAAQLRELNMDTLDQYYYESCINRAPHSALSEKCYGKLDEAIRSANPMMALDPDLAMTVEARLADLRHLAERKEPLTDPRYLWREDRLDSHEKGP